MKPKRSYYTPGGPSSVQKLRDLGFDPLEALVEAYHEIDAECKMQSKIRDKELVRLKADGKAAQYSADFHMQCIERRSNIADKLTRYGYARVPETTDLNIGLPSLSINLTDTNEGFTINAQETGSEDGDEEDQEDRDNG